MYVWSVVCMYGQWCVCMYVCVCVCVVNDVWDVFVSYVVCLEWCVCLEGDNQQCYRMLNN